VQLVGIIKRVYTDVKNVLNGKLSNELKVFETGVLRKIFECRREVVTGGWRRTRNGQLYDPVLLVRYDAGGHVKMIEIAGACGFVWNLRVP